MCLAGQPVPVLLGRARRLRLACLYESGLVRGSMYRIVTGPDFAAHAFSWLRRLRAWRFLYAGDCSLPPSDAPR